MKTLSFEQMEVINAGSFWDWLVDAWNAVSEFFVDAWYWLVYFFSGELARDFFDDLEDILKEW